MCEENIRILTLKYLKLTTTVYQQFVTLKFYRVEFIFI